MSLVTLLLCPRGKSPRCLLNRKLGGPLNGSGRCVEVKNLVPQEETKLPFLSWFTCRNDKLFSKC